MIVTQTGGVTLIGGGEVRAAELEAALALAPTLVAADGGANSALSLGHVPQATLGDLDSLTEAARARLPAGTVHHLPDQDTTDFEKCLGQIQARFIVAVGFLGQRQDHVLAVMSALAQHRGPPCLVLGAYDVIFALKGTTHLSLWHGARVSLMPMAPVTGTSKGLKWPIDGLDFAPSGQIGTSNHATSDSVEITVHGPGMLCLLAPEALASVVGALTEAQ